MFSRIKEQPEAVAVERKMQAKSNELKKKKKKLSIELEKYNRQLDKLQLEIAESLTGDSTFSAEDLSRSLKTVKAQITLKEEVLTNVESELEQQGAALEMVGTMYTNFLGWANEFDNVSLEEKKMILGQLIKRVELEKGYKINIIFDMDYEQFCREW